MDEQTSKPKLVNRRTALKYGASGVAVVATLAVPQIMSRSAFGANAKKITFISEESSPKAQAVYDRINAEFKSATGIEVTMEYPGFKNIAKRVATMIAAGTPAEIVWYGAGQAMDVALQGQLADVGDVANELGIPENLHLVVDGANRSIATSQQFVYGWYRSDLYEKKGLSPYTDWESYLANAEALNDPPTLYGNLVPSTNLGASHLLLETMFRKNDVHWFSYNAADKSYEVALDNPENMAKAVETLEFLSAAHKFSPEASNYNWGELMSSYYTEKVASSYYVGARLLDRVTENNPDIADATKPVSLPQRKTSKTYQSIQGFHIHKDSNVDGAKQYCAFFMKHPAYIDWLHSVPLHIIPAQREVFNSDVYKDHPIIQKRMDVHAFIDSIWEDAVAGYYWDGPELNPLTGLYQNDSLGGWMLAERNIRGSKSEDIIAQAADKIRKKMK